MEPSKIQSILNIIPVGAQAGQQHVLLQDRVVKELYIFGRQIFWFYFALKGRWWKSALQIHENKL
jgi:hypothetical protein